MLLLALMRRILGIFHLVVELEERIFYIVEARWRGFAGAGGTNGGHFGGGVVVVTEKRGFVKGRKKVVEDRR